MNRLKAQYLDYTIDGHWRVRCYEEQDDFIISAECFYNAKKWNSVVRFDQSDHDIYHADFYNNPKYEFFPEARTFEEKVNTAFAKLKEYCAKKLVKYEGKTLIYSTVVDGFKNQILMHDIPLKPSGQTITRVAHSISAGAYIINPVKSGDKK